MLRDLCIKKKLTFGFGAIITLILALLAICYQSFSQLSTASSWDRHSLVLLLEANRIEAALLQVQASTRGYLLGGDASVTELIAKQQEAVRYRLRVLSTATADHPLQQARIAQLTRLIDDWFTTVVRHQLETRQALSQLATSNDVQSGTRTISEVRALLAAFYAEEERLLSLRSRQSSDLQQSMATILILGGGLCVLLAIAIGYLLSRAMLIPLNNLTRAVSRIAAGDQSARATVLAADELGQVTQEFNRMAQTIADSLADGLAATNALKAKVDALLGAVSLAAAGDLTGKIEVSGSDAIGQLARGLDRMFENLRALLIHVQQAATQVNSAATEIAAAAKQQEVTGIEQAQTSVEVLGTTREISANTTQLLKTMQDASAVADYTTSATATAQNNLRRMDDTMQQMVSASDAINAKLAALSEKAANINSVLVTITKVADQTNILSLNAAIEAEKAGEAGRGFSVVATEIRRLADQTSVSTWDIEQMLKEMQSAVSASVMGMDKFAEEIRRSVSEVKLVTEQLSGVMGQVQTLTPQFDAVLQGMQSQAVGAQQIAQTMMLLSDTNAQTVDTLKSTSEAVRQLQYAAGNLQTSVASFAVAA